MIKMEKYCALIAHALSITVLLFTGLGSKRHLTKTFFTGMTSRDFRGIHSLQEVECFGDNLNSEVKLISLKMYKLPESTVVASLNVYTNNCMTYGDYASCVIHLASVHQSRLRLLVHDLEEGESREYGCTANTINPQGDSIFRNWKILLWRNSKYPWEGWLVVLWLCLCQSSCNSQPHGVRDDIIVVKVLHIIVCTVYPFLYFCVSVSCARSQSSVCLEM